MRSKKITLPVALALVAIALAGCHTSDTEMPAFTYTASDFGFDGPDTLPAGWVELTVANQGMEPHHIQLFRLDAGKTVADLTAYFETGEAAPPEWVDEYGGPNAAMPMASTSAIVHLDEGTYAMVCAIPSPDGTPHMHKGMVKEITVEGENDAAEPEADLEVDLHDFSFEKHGDWNAGTHMIAVTNAGAQPHELTLVRYHEGGNFSLLLQAFSPEATGPPPADFLGGITGIESGETQYFEAELTPGRYGLICFLEDPNSHAPHFALGMEQGFEVA